MVSAYPNPFSQGFSLVFNQAIEKAFMIKVINSQGMEVYRKAEYSASLGNKLEIALQDLPTGIYLLRIEAESGTQTIKLVKN